MFLPEQISRVFLVLADPSTYDASTGQFMAAVEEIDIAVFEAINNLPPDRRAQLGTDDVISTQVIMDERISTTAQLLSFLTAEITTPAKPN